MTSQAKPGMSWIPGGIFRMGSDRHYPEERPVHDVTVGGFWIDRYAVTNRDFAAFVAATGYKTMAERQPNPADYPGALPHLLKPGSLVFHMTRGPVDLHDISNWWHWTPGAYWRHPEGRGRSVAKRLDHPVVYVAFEDAEAYAHWAGKVLATEAEWEFAARGGLDGAEFVWGDEFAPGGHQMANTWQGELPWQNLCTDGVERTSSVGAPSRRTATGSTRWPATSGNGRPTGSPPGMKRHRARAAIPTIARWASRGQLRPGATRRAAFHAWWSRAARFYARNYCRRYRPAARHAQMVDSGMSHIGFRCAIRGWCSTVRGRLEARFRFRVIELGRGLARIRTRTGRNGRFLNSTTGMGG
jgi:formylglycine-generating enzyme